MDHLLLHCEVAYALWSEEFWMLGVYWVMPPTVTSLLCGWRSRFVKKIFRNIEYGAIMFNVASIEGAQFSDI